MSSRPKICQMVPTTFQGISSGMASSTSVSEARQPPRGIARAMATPSGISTASTTSENTSCRPSALCRSPSRSTCLNHSAPTKTFWVGPRMSCTE